MARPPCSRAQRKNTRASASCAARGAVSSPPWGAGPTGKRLARALEGYGLRPLAFFDVDRGKEIARGRLVLHEENLPPPGAAFMLCAVGAAGAREEIRALLTSREYFEGEHFLFAA